MTPYIVKEVLHYRNATMTKCTKMPPRIITYYDLTFVVKGTMTYFANGERFDICENDTILLPPGTLRQRLQGAQRVDYISFNFHILPECELKTPLFMKNVITADIKKLTDVFSQKHLSNLHHSKEKLTNLLNYILFEILDSVLIESNNFYIIKIKRYIDENITGKITLKMLSDHIHLSKEYISSIFKKHTGKTVIEYVNERKMLLAKQMIENGEISLKDISENLGFENYGYFSRSFRKYFGITPYAQKMNAKAFNNKP